METISIPKQEYEELKRYQDIVRRVEAMIHESWDDLVASSEQVANELWDNEEDDVWNKV